MDQVRAAIYGVLSADATLTALLSTSTAIYNERAPQEATQPYVVIALQAGTDEWTFGDTFERLVWLVKGVCRGQSATVAENIDARCKTLLNNVALTVTGDTPMGPVRRGSRVSYAEDDGGDTIFHRGGLYRFSTQSST